MKTICISRLFLLSLFCLFLCGCDMDVYWATASPKAATTVIEASPKFDPKATYESPLESLHDTASMLSTEEERLSFLAALVYHVDGSYRSADLNAAQCEKILNNFYSIAESDPPHSSAIPISEAESFICHLFDSRVSPSAKTATMKVTSHYHAPVDDAIDPSLYALVVDTVPANNSTFVHVSFTGCDLQDHIFLELKETNSDLGFRIKSFDTHQMPNAEHNRWKEIPAYYFSMFCNALLSKDTANPLWVPPVYYQDPSKSEPSSDLMDEAVRYYKAGNYKEAIPLLSKAAYYDIAEAKLYLGYCYQEGYGVPQDMTLGFQWLYAAACNGHSEAQSVVGDCYRHGYGVSVDIDKAIPWYEASAEQGCKFGLINLGYCYHYGLGVPKNYENAEYYYRQADAAGHHYAAKRLKELAQDIAEQ